MLMSEMNISEHLHPTGWKDYRLIDSGNGEKLEQFGPYRFVRPEAQALWSPRLQKAEWRAIIFAWMRDWSSGSGC